MGKAPGRKFKQQSTVSLVLLTVGVVTEPQKKQHKPSPPSCPEVTPHTKPCKMGTYSSEEPAVVEP